MSSPKSMHRASVWGGGWEAKSGATFRPAAWVVGEWEEQDGWPSLGNALTTRVSRPFKPNRWGWGQAAPGGSG